MRRWWLWAVLGVGLLLVSSSRTWATGTWADPVIGATRLEATGSGLGSTLTAGALLAGAALLAGLVGTRPVRLASAVCLTGGALLAGWPAVRTLLDPANPLTRVAADTPGATGLNVSVTEAASTPWPWIGLLGALLVLAGGFLCGALWVRGPQPDTRAATPGATPAGGEERSAGRGERAARPRNDWEDLSEGRDPTLDD